MRGRRNLPIFLGYVAAAVFVLGFLGRQMGGEFFLAQVYHVHAVFASGSQLVNGDDVTIAGVRVGRVDSLSPTKQGVDALLAIHTQYGPIRDQARAVIKAKNLLGETYVELTKGEGTRALKDYATIPISNTLTPVELAQVLDALTPDVRSRLVLVINSLGQSLSGRGGDLNTQAGDLKVLASAIDTITGSLASNSDHLNQLIISLGKILETLAAYRTEFRALIQDWDRLMVALYQKEADLQGTFREDARVMAIFDQALSGGGGQDLNAALAEAPQTLDVTNHYLDSGTTMFADLQPTIPDIDATFDRLASAFSATDSQGNHYWRVYCVGGPFPPTPPGVAPNTPCFQASVGP
ncbi:MAG: MCE family protein [Chloroflexi bacterium]|nr:MAG: MCE family protein [Chloroflexota bacterium]TME18372.1 MAG: MCE family protein [Chloroflexota bacterium]